MRGQKEMRADKAIGPIKRRSQPIDVERGTVGRDQRVIIDDGLDRAQHAGLDRGILKHRFDHDRRPGERHEIVGTGGHGGQPGLGRPARKVGPSRLQLRRIVIDQHHIEPGFEPGERDRAPHRARADHAEAAIAPPQPCHRGARPGDQPRFLGRQMRRPIDRYCGHHRPRHRVMPRTCCGYWFPRRDRGSPESDGCRRTWPGPA